MKIAIVHDYLNQAGGAERVVAAFHRMFPDAPIFTTIFAPDVVGEPLASADVRVSWMQRLPLWRAHFKKYLPLYPSAVQSFELRGYDMILSSSSAFAKGIRVPKGAVHICYCYTPMRFAWSFGKYVARSGLNIFELAAAAAVIGPLRAWDVRTSASVDRFVAISNEVAKRIRLAYNRDSDVVFPPVDADRFHSIPGKGEFFLVVSRLASYKRIDLAVKACTKKGLPLVIVGDGPARRSLQRLAGPTVIFLGRLPDAEVTDLFARCIALVLPGEEDFGLTPLEANASGRPAVALAAGGALDTVINGVTGLLFDKPDAESLGSALERARDRKWDAGALRAHAQKFSEDIFVQKMRDVITSTLEARSPALAGAFRSSFPTPSGTGQ